MRFTSILPCMVIGPVRSSTNSTPCMGSIQPCCHHGAGNYSNTQAITVQPRAHSLLSRKGAHTGKVPCPWIQHHTAATKTRSRDLPSRYKVAGSSHAPRLPGRTWSVYSDIATLKVVTARELVVLSGSFTSHSMSVRGHRHLRGRGSPERYAVSNVEGREINRHFYKPVPQRVSNPRPPAWQARMLPLRYCSILCWHWHGNKPIHRPASPTLPELCWVL